MLYSGTMVYNDDDKYLCVCVLVCCVFVMLDGPLTHACCVKYTRTPLDFKLIKGFAEQSSREVCRIDAIM